MDPLNYAPPTTPLEILHKDDALLVLAKPAGLLSVPGKDPAHHDCLLSRVQERDAQALLVHRLDMDTSGVMVFARTRESQRHLGLQFERRVLTKTYLAQVTNPPSEAHGCVDAPLVCDWPNRPLQKICHETGRPAQTKWWVVRRGKTEARLLLEPLTGRSHQLRVHLQSLGAPIVGDRFYGGADAPRLMLHASTLTLRHPMGGRWHRFESAAPF